MPVHDRTLVKAGLFHDFHTVWMGAIRNALNEGVLPDDFCALAGQHAGEYITDVLTLQESEMSDEPFEATPIEGGVAVAEAPPQVRLTETVELDTLARTLAIRHVSGHRLVTLLEIVSPSNKACDEHIEEFVDKAVSAKKAGVHLLVVDLFPPTSRDPDGIHGLIRRKIGFFDEPYALADGKDLTLAAYAANKRATAYVENVAVGNELPDMPLFIRSDRYVNVPLEATYQSTYRGVPKFWRNVLEGRAS